MRLLYTLPDFWPYVLRGSERIVHDAGTAMARRGHAVHLVTRTPDGDPRGVEMDGIRVSYGPVHARLARALHWTEDEAFSLTAARAGLTAPADVHHAFHLTDAYGLHQARRIRRRPLVLSWHGYPDADWWRANRPRVYRWTEAVMRTADRVTVMAEASARRMRETWGIDPVVLRPGLFVEDYARPRDRGGPPAIVCAAALDDGRKRLDVLIDAFALLAPGHPELELRLVGPGSTDMVRRRAEAKGPEVSRRVRTLPATDNLAPVYASATVGALTSHQEAYGMVVLEYIASGMPAVVADDGGSPELLGPGTGLSFTGGDVQACAAALEDALVLAEQPATEAACRAHAATFDWSVRADSYQALYDAVA